MIINNVFSFIIIATIGNILGNVQCLSREDFLIFEKSYFSGDGPPSTVFSAHDYVVKNTCCFVAFLHQLVTDSEKTDGYDKYRLYGLTNIHLLSMNLYYRHKARIQSLFTKLKDWKKGTKINETIKKEIHELIEAGHTVNSWYFEKENMTQRTNENIFLHFSDTNLRSIFNECNILYQNMKYDDQVLNLLETAVVNDSADRQGRMEIYKAMPLIITNKMTNEISNMNGRSPQLEDYTRMVGILVSFYEQCLLDSMDSANILLREASMKDKYNVIEWDSSAIQFFNDTIALHVDITQVIVDRLAVLERNLKRLRQLGGNHENANLISQTYGKYLQSYKDAVANLLKNEVCKPHESTHQEAFKYPSVLPYYRNFQLFPKQFTTDITMHILQLQAITSIFVVHSEFAIAAAHNVGLKEMKNPDEATITAT